MFSVPNFTQIQVLISKLRYKDRHTTTDTQWHSLQLDLSAQNTHRHIKLTKIFHSECPKPITINLQTTVSLHVPHLLLKLVRSHYMAAKLKQAPRTYPVLGVLCQRRNVSCVSAYCCWAYTFKTFLCILVTNRHPKEKPSSQLTKLLIIMQNCTNTNSNKKQ